MHHVLQSCRATEIFIVLKRIYAKRIVEFWPLQTSVPISTNINVMILVEMGTQTRHHLSPSSLTMSELSFVVWNHGQGKRWFRYLVVLPYNSVRFLTTCSKAFSFAHPERAERALKTL